MNALRQDILYGFRMLRKNPGFTLVAVMALALGIGANTALFSVVYGVLLKPLPYAQGNQLVVLDQDFRNANQQNIGFSVKEVQDYRGQTQSLSEVEEYHNMTFTLLNAAEPDRVRTGVVSAHFFEMLGVKPLLGRTFTEADDKTGADPVLVLSYDYWKNKHGGDPNVIGRKFRMNDKIHTVIGVLPSIPQYPKENDVYMPTVACPFRSSPEMIAERDMRMVRAFGRLKPGASLASANADLALIANRLQRAYPASYPSKQGFAASAYSLQKQLTEKIRPMLLVLLGTAGLVLLIACANVANLALARMARREQELAVRAALGADRARLIRQLLTESTMLGLAGGALGLLLASSSLQLLVAFAARFTTRAAEVRINGSVLLFTLVVSVLTGLVFGCIPAFSQRLNLVSALKEGGTSSTVKGSRHQMRALLVIGQVAISFILLIGAGLMIRSFLKLQQVDAGYNPDNILTLNIPLSFNKYKTETDTRTFFDRLEQKLQGQPGILAIAVTSGPPLSGAPGIIPFEIEGKVVGADGVRPTADLNIASPDAFSILGVPLISGRFFNKQDSPDSTKVVIVNRSFAQRYFPNQDPINKRLSGDKGAHWSTIVGVVGDVRAYRLDQEAIEMVYAPFAQEPGGISLMIRTAGDPLAYVKQVREAVYAIDSEQPIADVKTLDQLRGNSLAATRLTATLLALFSALALGIAASGLSGVIAFLVSQRTREIGIRMALGAERSDVLRMVLGHGMKLISIGLAVGMLGALAGSRLMHALLFNTPANDPATFALVALLFTAVAMVASYIPARRATQVDPMIALRAE